MAVYGVSIYGVGLYGNGSTVTVEDVLVTGRDQVSVLFDGPVKINSSLYEPSSYVFYDAETLQRANVFTRNVFTVNDPQLFTRRVELDTSLLDLGKDYLLLVSGLYDIQGRSIADQLFAVRGRSTKVNSIRSSLPSHYDQSIYSNIRGLLTAIAISDDEIGGSRRDLSLTFEQPADTIDLIYLLTDSGDYLTTENVELLVEG